MTFCECLPPHLGGTYPNGTLKPIFHRDLKQGHPAQMVSSWHDVLLEYSALNLSHEADKLPALSGLAKQNGRGRLSAKYLAGLWSNSIMIDLLWSSHYSSRVKLERGPEAWRAPSWSWASQNTVVRFPTRIPDIMMAYIDLVSCETIPATLDPTGKVSAGTLVVSGKLRDARIIREFVKEQDLEEGKIKMGTVTLRIQDTGAQIQLRFVMFDSGEYVIRGVSASATVTMDSPFHLLHSEMNTQHNDYYKGSQVKCLQLVQVGYAELLEGRGTTWEEDQRQKKGSTGGQDGGEREEKKEEEGEEEEEEGEDEEQGQEEKEGSEAGEKADQDQDKPTDWVCHSGVEDFLRQLVRSSAEYSLILQKLEGDNTYRRIGMLIQHRSVGPNEPPRPMLPLWSDNPSVLDSDEGVETTITIL